MTNDQALNSLPAANRRPPVCFPQSGEVRCSLASSRHCFPAAVAKGERSALTK